MKLYSVVYKQTDLGLAESFKENDSSEAEYLENVAKQLVDADCATAKYPDLKMIAFMFKDKAVYEQFRHGFNTGLFINKIFSEMSSNDVLSKVRGGLRNF